MYRSPSPPRDARSDDGTSELSTFVEIDHNACVLCRARLYAGHSGRPLCDVCAALSDVVIVDGDGANRDPMTSVSALFSSSVPSTVFASFRENRACAAFGWKSDAGAICVYSDSTFPQLCAITRRFELVSRGEKNVASAIDHYPMEPGKGPFSLRLGGERSATLRESTYGFVGSVFEFRLSVDQVVSCFLLYDSDSPLFVPLTVTTRVGAYECTV